jgi:radical S-adenosyl methionine domain-containing protein 2
MFKKVKIPAVNYHLWEPCNMRCQFCFATFQDVKNTLLPKGHLPKQESIEVVKAIAAHGFEKITFAGGEPTLCPWLDELIRTAKEAGMTTTIVTNGTKLDKDFLQRNRPWLDWIALSVDSLDHATNLAIGRAIIGKRPIDREHYLELVSNIREFGYGLKINTVVNSYNSTEQFDALIEHAKPDRWKIFQVTPIVGQNDGKVEKFLIPREAFNSFVDRHRHLSTMTTLVPENEDQIIGSYAMIDPAGRFFDDAEGTHRYSEPILTIGVEQAFAQVAPDPDKFLERGGQYDWKLNK